METFVSSIFEQSAQNQTKISEIFDNKVDLAEFRKQVDNFEEQIDTIRMATYDNFRVVRATDNFLEKYLPFQIQDLISRNISSFIKKPFTDEEILAGADLRLNPEQQKMQNNFDAFKEIEYKIYKENHRRILNDDGLPSIKKTAFRLPDFHQVVTDKNLGEY